MEQRYIYNRKYDVDKALAELSESRLSNISQQYIKEFDHENKRCNNKNIRRFKLVCQMVRFANVLETQFNKDLSQLDRETIEEYMCLIYQDPDMRPYTKLDYFRLVRQFVKRHPKLNPEILLEHKSNGRTYERFKFREELKTLSENEQIITEADIKKVLSDCKCKRNKAFISLLHESGARAGEILNIRYKDIRFKDKLLIIKVDGKTGQRDIPILFSKPYLTEYLNEFPKAPPNEYIWKLEGNFNKQKKEDALSYSATRKVVHEAFVKAGLEDKKHNLHYFRHSQATINAEFMTEAQMCKFFGWVLGSGQTATYVNMNTLDIENALLIKHGLGAVKSEDSDMSLKSCQVCGYNENMATANYCQRCANPLSLKVVLDDDKAIKEETDKTIKLLMEIAKNPELMAKFDEFRKAKG
ncbi:MAG: site-specific integrase [Nanoarchaeota archaeon]|nr:site-specific integrase [Nanoarchaeota archaeon]